MTVRKAARGATDPLCCEGGGWHPSHDAHTDELTALVAAHGVPVACHVHGGVTFEAVTHLREGGRR